MKFEPEDHHRCKWRNHTSTSSSATSRKASASTCSKLEGEMNGDIETFTRMTRSSCPRRPRRPLNFVRHAPYPFCESVLVMMIAFLLSSFSLIFLSETLSYMREFRAFASETS